MVIHAANGERIGLLRGTGYDLGEYALRYARADRTMLRVLRDQARARPDHPWLIFDSERSLTFEQAYHLTNRVASALRETVGAGSHVGLFLRNQLEFMPSFYGAMTNSGVAVPLNADARGPLLQYVIEAADLKVIVARVDALDRFEALDSLGQVELVVAVGDGEVPAAVSGVDVVRWDAWLDGREAAAPEVLPAHNDMAVLQFTSGTTGRPKGAIYSHQFLYLYAAMIADSLGRRADDVLSTPLPLFHVAALHIITNTALHAGCTAHLKSQFSASRYWQQIADDGATFSIILGPMAAIILKTVPEAPPHKMPSMFVVPPIQREEFERRYNVTMLYQGYGMTEVYPLPMRPDMLQGKGEDTIGYPVSWMEYGVVDEHDNLLAPGEAGELVFRPLLPHGMVDGYYKNPEATTQALRNFMFHTGDLATYDEDGCLHYKGRKQERIRYRGENVSALELEFVALSHPDVVEAAAYGVPAEFGEEDVKLDVTLGRDVELPELRDWLAQNLPKYMVPRYLERVDSFPKTPSERVEKYKLKDRPLDRPEVFDAGDRR